MQEFIEKLIGRLEEQNSDLTTWAEDKAFEIGIQTAISIVNQLAEEHNNGWIACNGCNDCKHEDCEHYGKV